MNPTVAHGLAAVAGGVAVFCTINAYAAKYEGKVFEAIGSLSIGLFFAGAAFYLATL